MFSNRLYSQRSRQKKKKIVEDLEERVKILEVIIVIDVFFLNECNGKCYLSIFEVN